MIIIIDRIQFYFFNLRTTLIYYDILFFNKYKKTNSLKVNKFLIILVYHNRIEILLDELQHKVIIREWPKSIQVTHVTTTRCH